MYALFLVIDLVLQLYIWILIAAAIFSWLVAFSVVNVRNPAVGMIGDFLYRITEPVLRPVRRLMPNLGGLDISPVIERAHAAAGGRFHLAADIALARGVVADKYHREPWRDAAVTHQTVHGVRHPAAQVGRDSFAVDDGCGHCPSCCGPAAPLDT